VREQVPERHLGRAGRGLDPEALQEVVDRVVELEQTLVAQLHHADRGERLRDRRDAEHRVGVDRPASDVIGQPETFELAWRVREYHCGGEPTQAVPPPDSIIRRAQVGIANLPSGECAGDDLADGLVLGEEAVVARRRVHDLDALVARTDPQARVGAATGRAGRSRCPRS
jgi:hypothetical protein